MIKLVTIEPNFTSWRDAARGLLAAGLAPRDVAWSLRGEEAEELFGLTEYKMLHE